MKQKIVLVLGFCLIYASTLQADIFSIFAPAEQKLLIVGDVQKREHSLDVLKQEKEKLSSEGDQKEANGIQKDINKTASLIAEYKKKLSSASEKEKDYLNTVVGVLNETSQLLLDTQLLRQRISQTIDTHISLLEGNLKDPNFKSSRLEVSAVYSFEELQKLHQEILSIKEKVKQFKDQLEVLRKEQEDAKQEVSIIGKELKEKEHEQSTFNGDSRSDFVSEGSWGVSEEAKLLDFEIKQLSVKKDSAEFLVKDLSYRVGVLTTRLDIANSKLEIFEMDLEDVDRALRVSDSEVEAAREELLKKRNETSSIQTQYSQEIRMLSQSKRGLREQFDKILEQSKIDLRSPQELDDWKIDFSKYPSEMAIYRLAYLNERIRVIDGHIGVFEAKRFLEKVKLASEEVLVKKITSWHQISQRSLRSEEIIEQEKLKYANNKLEGQRTILTYRDKLELASNDVNNQSKALDNLEAKIKEVKSNSSSIIKSYGNEGYRQIVSMLDHSKKLLNVRIDLNRKLIAVYNSIAEEEKSILRQVEMVEERLGKIGIILQRSEHAISWDNIKNIGPSLGMFVFDLKTILLSNLRGITFSNIWIWLKENVEHPTGIFYLFLTLLALLLLFLFLKQLLIFVASRLREFRVKAVSLGTLWGIGLLVVEVLGDCLLSFMSWVTLFVMVGFGWITNLGFQVLFYLGSIAYLCYLTRIIFHKLVKINRENEYIILSDAVEERFVRVFSFFAYSTVIIFFFREAFSLITYESDLPTKVLPALYSIILRASIIFLIGREELASLIPERGAIWELIRTYVTRYYYPMMVGIIAMMVVSDPYILGFSKLVSFVFWGTILTIILFFAARWLQEQTRKLSAYAFFYSTESGGTRERFSNSKTWYGMLIVLLYFVFAILCILLLAKIWGYSFHASDIYKWLDRDLPISVLKFTKEKPLGESVPLTPNDLLQVVLYFMVGVWLAWGFDRLVLRRVFSLLLVDNGAQNTISIISRYVIVITALFLGLSSVHLGGFIIYVMGALAFGVVWAIKDPVNDFISYFIILIDRTVKIGDFIEVDDRIIGVVRKISPRSVLVRRKNSVSIVVPNSKLTTMPVYNWGYTRGFFAFSDFYVTVPYSANTKQVKEVLHRVLDENLNVLKSPAPIIRLSDFGDYGFKFLIRGFLSSINVLNQWDIVSDLRLEIVEELRKIGVPIAAPLRLMVNREDIKNLYNLEGGSTKEDKIDPNDDGLGRDNKE